MFRKNLWFALVLSFFCAFVVPEKKAEAFIFRAAARAVGAVVGFTAAVVAGAARVVANTARIAAIGVARVAVGAFRVGRFLLFGRPWAPVYAGYNYGYRPYYNYYSPYQNYYPQQTYYTPSYGNGSTHTNTGGWNNARTVDNSSSIENWCAQEFPITDSYGTKKAYCEIEWNGNRYYANGRNLDWAQVSAQRWACEAGAKPEAIRAIAPQCQPI